MNSETTLKFLALLFSLGTIVAAIHTVVTRGNAGASVMLMVFAVIFITLIRIRKSNNTAKGPNLQVFNID